MEEVLKRLLESWKVSARFIDNLLEEEVYSIETLLLLTDEMIRVIFDKAGPRATFIHNLNRLRDESFNKISIANLTDENGETTSGSAENSVLSTAGSSSFHGSGETDENKEARTCIFTGLSVDAGEEFKGNKDIGELLITPALKTSVKENMSSSLLMGRKRTASAACSSQFGSQDIDLESLLIKCLKGKEVRAYYEEHKELNDSHRNKLADVILNEYLADDHARKLPHDVEESMTALILETFPSEIKETWVSSAAAARESSVGRGIIIKRYYNIRRTLKSTGVIKKTCMKTEEESRLTNILIDNEGNSDSITEALSWLNYNKQPWSKLLTAWQETSSARLRCLISGTQSINSYMDAYPALKDKTGYLLLESDFEKFYPNANSFYAQWPTLTAFIEKYVPHKVLQTITDSLTPEGKKVRTIQALPHLFSVVTVAKSKNSSYRPSRQEVSEALILCVPAVSEIAPTLAARLEKFKPFGLQLSPQAVLVGDDEDSISKSFVRVNNVIYEVENQLKAFDVTFKLMHALDSKYHEESKREWLFIERAVYGINEKKPGVDTQTANRLRDYNKFKTGK